MIDEWATLLQIKMNDGGGKLSDNYFRSNLQALLNIELFLLILVPKNQINLKHYKLDFVLLSGMTQKKTQKTQPKKPTKNLL